MIRAHYDNMMQADEPRPAGGRRDPARVTGWQRPNTPDPLAEQTQRDRERAERERRERENGPSPAEREAARQKAAAESPAGKALAAFLAALDAAAAELGARLDGPRAEVSAWRHAREAAQAALEAAEQAAGTARQTMRAAEARGDEKCRLGEMKNLQKAVAQADDARAALAAKPDVAEVVSALAETSNAAMTCVAALQEFSGASQIRARQCAFSRVADGAQATAKAARELA